MAAAFMLDRSGNFARVGDLSSPPGIALYTRGPGGRLASVALEVIGNDDFGPCRRIAAGLVGVAKPSRRRRITGDKRGRLKPSLLHRRLFRLGGTQRRLAPNLPGSLPGIAEPVN